jgi:hypothetical protein
MTSIPATLRPARQDVRALLCRRADAAAMAAIRTETLVVVATNVALFAAIIADMVLKPF